MGFSLVQSFWDLDEVERAVLDVASEEGLPWEVCATWRRDPKTRSTDDVERSRGTVGRLIERGLVWMYRLDQRHDDLSRDEVMGVLAHPHAWDYLPNWSHDVALYLTPEGERLFYGAASDERPPIPD